MIGNHCIKSWAKTQSVIAKSSAESELYSVVKGATEGLGLATLCQDMGAETGIRLNLDATAAKGILERQGISKVRHIDVNVLWLQQQVARKLVPLIKVDGTANCADLLTKHLAANVQERHIEMMKLEFRAGRASIAAQLHAVSRAKAQGEFKESGGADRWAERGENGLWVRVHNVPRACLFTPKSVPNGPGRKSRLAVTRETIGISELGDKFAMTDDWTSTSKRALTRRWTGVTVFRAVPVDDRQFGGDQRRQRDRAGQPESSPKKPRVSWADIT